MAVKCEMGKAVFLHEEGTVQVMRYIQYQCKAHVMSLYNVLYNYIVLSSPQKCTSCTQRTNANKDQIDLAWLSFIYIHAKW